MRRYWPSFSKKNLFFQNFPEYQNDSKLVRGWNFTYFSIFIIKKWRSKKFLLWLLQIIDLKNLKSIVQVFNMGGMWVETSSLKFLGIFDDQIEKNKTHCEKYKKEDFVDDGIYQYSGWDSYFYLAIIAFTVGTIWYAIFFKIIKKIEKFPIDDWRNGWW